jgi:carbon monoxide dehydrogenase subunit G
VRLEHSIDVARPPAEVYAFVADPSNLPRWQGPVDAVEWEGGEASAGDRFREVRTFMGRRVHSSVEVTVAEPPREFTVSASAGPVDVVARHLLEAAGEGTRVRVEVEAERVPRLMAGMAARAARRQAEEDLARLKRLLEE